MPRSLLLPRFLFIAAILLAIILAFSNGKQINIDTNLAELNPNNQHANNIAPAIETLGDNIQRRVLLLVSSNDEDQALDASDQLRNQLANVTDINLLADNDSIASNLIDTLKPYRFSLLNEQQRQRLKNEQDTTIAAKAKAALFSLSPSNQFYSFAEDPLGWHSDFITNLLSANQKTTNSNDAFYSVISLLIEEGAMDMRQQQLLSVSLDEITKSITNDFDVSVDRSGVFFFAADAAQKSKQDISFISMGSTIGVVLLLLVAFRSAWSLALPIISVLVGVAFAFIITHSLYGRVHVLTIVFGTSLIGIVIDYSLHYFYHRAADQYSANDNSQNNRALHRALFLSLMTSLIGYSALGFSDLQALQKVAVFSCCGLFAAWLCVVCIGDFATRKKISLEQYLIPKLQSSLLAYVGVLNHKLWLALAAISLIAAMLLVKSGQAFSDDPRLFYKASGELVASEQAVAQIANDYEPGRYLVVHGENKQQIYQHTNALLTSLKQEPNFDTNSLTTIVNWVPSAAQQAQNYQLQNQLYKEDGIATRMLQQVSASPAIIKQLMADYKAANSTVLEPEVIVEQLKKSAPTLWHMSETGIVSFMLIRKGSDSELLQNAAAQHEGVTYINTIASSTEALKLQREAASALLLTAYVLVALLIAFRYRSVKPVTMLLVPLVSSAMVLLVCVSFGLPLNLFHVMALFLVLGFGMDYTIFIQELRDTKQITLQAILLSALTSLLSFGLLGLSSIPVAQSFGLSLLIGNSFNLLGVFVYSHFQKH